jgi:hypothetical protein
MKMILGLIFLVSTSAFASGEATFSEYKLKFKVIEKGIELDPSVAIPEISLGYQSPSENSLCSTGGFFEPSYGKRASKQVKLKSDGLLTVVSSFKKGIPSCKYDLESTQAYMDVVDSEGKKYFGYADFFRYLRVRSVDNKYVSGDFRGATVIVTCGPWEETEKFVCKPTSVDYDNISSDKVTTIEIHID